MRSENFVKQGLIDHNINCFRSAICEVFHVGGGGGALAAAADAGLGESKGTDGPADGGARDLAAGGAAGGGDLRRGANM